jgi:hypothetical protein
MPGLALREVVSFVESASTTVSVRSDSRFD